MRKLLLALFAMALVVAFTADSYAADLKMTGFYRVRGASTNNEDQNDDVQDGKQYYDQLIRPRFTAKSGAVTGMLELEAVGTGAGAFGGNDRTTKMNRYIIDFAIPGSALRMRLGRTDYTSPDGEIFDTGGKSRLSGIAIYGKLAKNTSLSMFNSKSSGGGGTTTEDQDNYLVALSMKVSPTLTLTPWVANSRSSAGDSYNYWYGAVTLKAKMGILGLNVTGVVQEGEMSSAEDISAWGFLVRASTSLGKLKLLGNATILSGDDEAGGDRNQFLTPRGGSSGWFQGGQIMTSKRWLSFGNDIRDREYKGANGIAVIEGLLEYKVSKTLMIGGGVSVYQSAEASTAAGMNNSKDVGSEVNVGFAWTIHKGLVLKGVGAFFAAGDYGQASGDRKRDDTWLVGWDLTHKF